MLPDEWGGVIWKFVNCGLYALGNWGIGKASLPRRVQSATQVAAYFIAGGLPMSMHSMYNSQANLMMFGSFLLGVAAAAELSGTAPRPGLLGPR